MKLIDLLVQELGGKGGWPSGGTHCVQDSNGQIWFFRNGTPFYERGVWAADSESNTFGWTRWGIYLSCTAKDHHQSIVTREQYEAALAESQQPAWNGEGLPPVGTICEFFNDDFDCRDSVPENRTIVEIVAHQKSKSGIEVAVFTWHGESCSVHAEVCNEYLFRPIRTEAERKREDAIDAIANLCHRSDPGDDATEIYDAIAAGKIPGVKLDDF